MDTSLLDELVTSLRSDMLADPVLRPVVSLATLYCIPGLHSGGLLALPSVTVPAPGYIPLSTW